MEQDFSLPIILIADDHMKLKM